MWCAFKVDAELLGYPADHARRDAASAHGVAHAGKLGLVGGEPLGEGLYRYAGAGGKLFLGHCFHFGFVVLGREAVVCFPTGCVGGIFLRLCVGVLKVSCNSLILIMLQRFVWESADI